MARMIQAYQRYRPRIRRNKLATLDHIADYISASTGLDKYEIKLVLGKLQSATLHFARQGRGVRLEGIVSLWPIIDTHGKFRLGRRFNSTLTAELNDLSAFGAYVSNYERCEWTAEDYRNAWDAEFPGDPIED
jgi:hypothetical protein